MPETYGEVYNVGADREYTVNELAKSVCLAMDVKPDIVYLPERHEVKHAYASHEKAKRTFNYTAKFSFEEGLQRMAKWALRVGPRKSKEFENIEVKKCLPEAWL
jgi:UDP-glucose 4-epimerase